MGSFVLVREIGEHLGQIVSVRGWVVNHRSSGKVSFVEIRDGSGYIQAVLDSTELDDSVQTAISRITMESAVAVEGRVQRHPKREDEFELHVTSLDIIHRAVDYPITKKEHGPNFLLENRHLWLRSRSQWAIQRIRTTVIKATYDFLVNDGFIKIDSPIITSVACEETTTLFDLEYFNLGKAYLSQSGQLYLEAAASAHGRVFDFGPVFRAEKSKTRKHLTEFWMMDAEMAFFDHKDNMRFQEKLILHLISEVLRQNHYELKVLKRDVSKLESIQAPFARITHREVVKRLRELGSDITDDMDLGAGDETLLAEMYAGPVFIERWPAHIKAFYMKACPDEPGYVFASDLMAPEGFGEIVGGSQREDDYDVLLERMKRENLPVEAFSWYLDLRKYGSVPHSGFGFGLERLVAWLSGAGHIRETIPFPRMIYRMTP